MRKLRKKYKNSRSPWSAEELEKNKEILRIYGLKKKKEILIAMEVLRNFRRRARNLITTKDEEKKKMLIDKVVGLGLLKKGGDLDDILALSINNILDRRLQTVVFRKGFAKTVKHARQLIVHGYIVINDERLSFPAYLIPVSEEAKIEVIEIVKKKKPAEKPKKKAKPTEKSKEEKPAEKPKEEKVEEKPAKEESK
ncbi:MAG: 30S ribosomal protein S4 [Candidatus Aenigmarchaeota archaeon]|nr:30S ribosomal protein S4 [Candidatus Aenigmarchaeota archaeon]